MLYSLKLLLSNLHLLIARTLAEGKWSRFLVLLINVVILTLVMAAGLFVVYRGICLVGSGIQYGTEAYKPENIFDAAYYLLFMNGGQNMYVGSHWVGGLITSFGILFIAVLTSMFTNYFERIGQNYLSGESTFLMKNHIVIIGTSDVLYSILSSQKGQQDKKEKTRFLIMTSRKVEEKRREILSFINNEIKSNHIIFIYGDRTSEKDINRLSLAYAKEVFIIGDSEESDSVESYRDSNNMDCVELIAQNQEVTTLRKGNNKLPCHVMFEYQTTFVAFQFSDMGDSYKEHIDFMPFNFYDMWAQKVLVAGEKDKTGQEARYEYLDKLPSGNYIDKDSSESVHLIIIGITKMGVALGIQAAQVCHFPNFISNHSRRTRITFIDTEADTELNYFYGRYKSLFKDARHRFVNLSKNDTELKKPWKNDDSFLDVEWEFIKGRIESPQVQTFIKEACADPKHTVTLAVCLTRSHQSIATAMFLPESVFQNCLQILVYQRLSGTIIDKVAKPDDKEAKDESGKKKADEKKKKYRYHKIRPFGMIDCGYDPKFEKETINRAKYISYVYDSYYRTDENKKELNEWDEKLENYHKTFVCYRDYTDYDDFWAKEKKVWERLSCQFNALSLNTKLRSIGMTIADSGNLTLDDVIAQIGNHILNLQQVEHNRWNMEKLLTGYRALTNKERRELKGLWDAWHLPGLTDETLKEAKDSWSNRRKELKDWPHRAHLDICSFGTLKDCEEETVLKHDVMLNTAIPYILSKEGKID